MIHLLHELRIYITNTRSSAIAQGLRKALCQLKFLSIFAEQLHKNFILKRLDLE